MDLDWQTLLHPDTPPLEIAVRGTLTFLSVFVIMRLLHREAGSLELTDLLLVVFLADASQNAMSGGYSSIGDGVLLVAVIGFWAHMLNYAAFRSQRLERIIRGSPMLLVRDGELLHRNLRRNLISRHELMAELRKQDVEDVAEVKRAYLEANGSVSIFKHDGHGATP